MITHVLKTKSGLTIPVTRNESIFWYGFYKLSMHKLAGVEKRELDSLEIIRMDLELALTHSENMNKAKQASGTKS